MFRLICVHYIFQTSPNVCLYSITYSSMYYLNTVFSISNDNVISVFQPFFIMVKGMVQYSIVTHIHIIIIFHIKIWTIWLLYRDCLDF